MSNRRYIIVSVSAGTVTIESRSTGILLSRPKRQLILESKGGQRRYVMARVRTTGLTIALELQELSKEQGVEMGRNVTKGDRCQRK